MPSGNAAGAGAPDLRTSIFPGFLAMTLTSPFWIQTPSRQRAELPLAARKPTCVRPGPNSSHSGVREEPAAETGRWG